MMDCQTLKKMEWSNFINNIDTDGDGLDDAFEGVTVNDPYDVNDNIDDPATSVLPDND